MPPDVRVHVRLGSVRLSFEGERSFYESHVESLLDAASKRDVVVASVHASPVAVPPPSIAVPAGKSVPAAASPAPRDGAAARSAVVAPRAARESSFVPSGEFGRYIRRLGPEAGEPDRQVVALAFYLWNYERRATFGRAELEGCFRALGMPLPTETDAILVDLTERKRFLETASEGVFRLSRKGENYVKTRLLAS